jgi:hypothetical protein
VIGWKIPGLKKDPFEFGCVDALTQAATSTFFQTHTGKISLRAEKELFGERAVTHKTQ